MKIVFGILLICGVCNPYSEGGFDNVTTVDDIRTTALPEVHEKAATIKGLDCTTVSREVKIDQQNLRLLVFWDLNIALECYYRYSISIETIPPMKNLSSKPCDSYNVTATLLQNNGTRIVALERSPKVDSEDSLNICKYEYAMQSGEWQLLTNFVTVYYEIVDVFPCTRYQVTLDVIQDDNNQVAAHVVDTIDTENVVSNQTEDLNIRTTVNSIFLTWTPTKYADICKTGYDIHVTKTKPTNGDIPYYRHERRTQHDIHKLESCTSYNVSVVPSDMVWVSDSDYESNPSVPTMVHIVSTSPEEVSNLHIEANDDGGSTIKWDAPPNTECIKEYQITVNDQTWSTNNNNVNIDRVAYCQDVTITPISFDNQSGKVAHISKPGPVRDLDSYVEAQSVIVQWSPPLINNCVKDYVVRLNDGKVWFTRGSEFTLEDLKSCTGYEIRVLARSTDNTTGSISLVTTETPPPQEIGIPVNLTIEYENTSLVLNWEPPENSQECNISYGIRITDDKNNEVHAEETYELNQTIDFNSSIGCMEYTIAVTPQVSPTHKGKSAKQKKKISKVRNAPTCKVSKTTSNATDLECDIGNFETNLCSLHNLTIKCSPNKIWRTAKLKDMLKRSSPSPLVSLHLDNLTAFTNYMCIGRITNTAGQSPQSTLITFRTQENVPSAPQHITIVDLKNTSFTVEWAPPQDVQGTLLKYEVSVEYKSRTYFVPSDCTTQPGKNILADVNCLKNQYTFNDAHPASSYTVYVQAVTGAGPGKPSNPMTFVTKGGVPEEPRDVNFVINGTSDAEYNIHVTVTWLYPCYTNGKLKHFIVGLVGYGSDLQNHTDHSIIIPSDQQQSIQFASKFRLLPAFNYIITVTTVTQENLISNPVILNFISPESYPDAPIIKSVHSVTKSECVIEWNKPPNPNGVLTNYKISIINEGPLHKIPKDCMQETASFSFTQAPDTTSYKFVNGSSNYRYKVTIAAATKIGYGVPSQPVIVDTLQSESEEIRDHRLILSDMEDDRYNVTATITFKYPCNTNSHFKQFLVNIFGSRTDYPIYKNETYVEGFLNQYNKFEFQVLPAHKYTVTIQSVTEYKLGKSVPITFSSPAGIPPILNIGASLAPPESFNVSSMQISLDRNMFSEVNGPILYYAVIIASDLVEIKPDYGMWDGINWPQLQYGFFKQNVIMPYQATPNFWNPFDGNGLSTYMFIIGDTQLSKTNVPLIPNAAYTVLVRGFTEDGYRNTAAVRFIVPGVDDSDVALIVGLVFGTIGTITLVIIAFLCKKRPNCCVMCFNVIICNRRLAKKNSVKLVQLTPLSVSIENFPDYYNKIKTSSEVLKEEFMLLTRKSNEIVLSTTEALRPENKKKNRYTNVLPYDKTRVRLLFDVDDTSDYINASYVQGYSSKTEYIATQGPLEHTCQDFWQMVIQENTSLIVMIAQFVELNKQKCFKYFPGNHETMELECGIAIRCCTELSFKSYTVRTLLVQKDLLQWTITHLQFTEWPDFGCPEGTKNTLEFSQLIRKHAQQNDDPIIVHCSAGVGRTGTLIALDILFQALANKEDIDIFGTVLNLRRDRKSMVQTEKQYLYIHECISTVIENPEILQDKVNDTQHEALYENLDKFKMENMDDSISESCF